MDLAKCSGWWTPLKDIVIFQHKPKQILFDNRNRLHNINGPAISYRSGLVNVYAIHGVIVNKNIIDKKFDWENIEKENNVEKRRVMIDLYGQDKYIQHSGAEIINSDDWGVLYRKKQINDEDIFMVKVVNSTQEPDGTYKDYFLRVDPKCYGGLNSAKAAIASTWRNKDNTLLFNTPDDYVLSEQT